MKRIGLALLAVAGAGVVGVAVSDGQPPAAFRFTGYVEGANSGPGHAFVVGDGLNLAFRDDVGGRTRYRVCWARRATRPRCWVRRTLSRDAGLVTFNDTFNATTGDFLGETISPENGPHPDLDSGFALFCDVIVPALT